MGEAASQIRLVSSVADAEQVAVRDPERVAFITQTTLSMEDTRPIVEALRRRFPKIHVPAKDDICYATQNRQVAVRALARQAPVILVVGSRNSSNSNRLVEEAALAGARAYLVDDVSEIDPAWLEGVETIGITSGASAPGVSRQRDRARSCGPRREVDVDIVLTVEEDVHFPLPPEVAGARRAQARRDAADPLVAPEDAPVTAPRLVGQGRLRHRRLARHRRGDRAAARRGGRPGRARCARPRRMRAPRRRDERRRQRGSGGGLRRDATPPRSPARSARPSRDGRASTSWSTTPGSAAGRPSTIPTTPAGTRSSRRT